MKKLNFLKMTLLAVVMMVGSVGVMGQVNIVAGGTYSENFDGIGTSATATLPTGWKMENISSVRSVTSAYASVTNNTTTRASDFDQAMSSTAGNGRYNFGGTTENDRAIGGLSSSSASKSVNMYLQLKNNGTSQISGFNISYDAERYRNGSNTAGFSIRLYYSTTGLANSWNEITAGIASFTANADNNGSTPNPLETISVTDVALNQVLNASESIYLA